jgi:hypothetical protein
MGASGFGVIQPGHKPQTGWIDGQGASRSQVLAGDALGRNGLRDPPQCSEGRALVFWAPRLRAPIARLANEFVHFSRNRFEIPTVQPHRKIKPGSVAALVADEATTSVIIGEAEAILPNRRRDKVGACR